MFAPGERRHDEPTFLPAASTVPQPDWAVPAEDCICNVVRVDFAVSEVLEAVVREDERPVKPHPRHTGRVCIRRCKSRERRGDGGMAAPCLGPPAGLGAGEGYLVVPASNRLTAWKITPP